MLHANNTLTPIQPRCHCLCQFIRLLLNVTGTVQGEGLQPPTFWQLSSHNWFFLRTCRFQTTKRSQKHCICTLLLHFQTFEGLGFQNFPGGACHHTLSIISHFDYGNHICYHCYMTSMNAVLCEAQYVPVTCLLIFSPVGSVRSCNLFVDILPCRVSTFL